MVGGVAPLATPSPVLLLVMVAVVVVVVLARDGSGSGDGYQNCACHYNFKAGFPRSTVAWSLVQEAGDGGELVERPKGSERERKREREMRRERMRERKRERETGERAVRGGHR